MHGCLVLVVCLVFCFETVYHFWYYYYLSPFMLLPTIDIVLHIPKYHWFKHSLLCCSFS